MLFFFHYLMDFFPQAYSFCAAALFSIRALPAWMPRKCRKYEKEKFLLFNEWFFQFLIIIQHFTNRL